MECVKVGDLCRGWFGIVRGVLEGDEGKFMAVEIVERPMGVLK